MAGIKVEFPHLGKTVEPCEKLVEDFHQLRGRVSRRDSREADDVSVENTKVGRKKIILML